MKLFVEVLQAHSKWEYLVGSTSAWTDPVDEEFIKKSPEEIEAWLAKRLSQLDGIQKAGVGPAAELQALGTAAAALREKDRAMPPNRNLAEPRFRVLWQAIGLVERSGGGPMVGITAGMKAFLEDHPEEEDRYGMLVARRTRAVCSVARALAWDYWETICDPGKQERHVFIDRVTKGAALVLRQELETVYQANLGNKGGHLAAVYLISDYWYHEPQRMDEANKLILKHRPDWEKDRYLKDEAERVLMDIAYIPRIDTFSLTDTKGKVWGIDDLRGRTTVLCFCWPGTEFGYSGVKNRAGGAFVLAIPLGKGRIDESVFDAIADPERTDVRGLMKVLHRDLAGIGGEVLVTPDLDVYRTSEGIAKYIGRMETEKR